MNEFRLHNAIHGQLDAALKFYRETRPLLAWPSADRTALDGMLLGTIRGLLGRDHFGRIFRARSIEEVRIGQEGVLAWIAEAYFVEDVGLICADSIVEILNFVLTMEAEENEGC